MENSYFYHDVIGLPSGEVLELPRGIVKKLIDKHLVYNEFIFDGYSNRLRYAFDDDDYDDIIDFLGTISDDEW